MKVTWIGRHRPITIGPVIKPWTDLWRDRRMRDVVFVYIIEKVAHAYEHTAPIEWFSSTPGLGVVPRLLSEICWLRIQ